MALLNLIRHIEDGCLFRFLLLAAVSLGFVGILYYVNLGSFLLGNQILDGLILVVQILEQQIIHHLFAELVIL